MKRRDSGISRVIRQLADGRLIAELTTKMLLLPTKLDVAS